jgi:hypothetical protein
MLELLLMHLGTQKTEKFIVIVDTPGAIWAISAVSSALNCGAPKATQLTPGPPPVPATKSREPNTGNDPTKISSETPGTNGTEGTLKSQVNGGTVITITSALAGEKRAIVLTNAAAATFNLWDTDMLVLLSGVA